jgi:hypothetical protein
MQRLPNRRVAKGIVAIGVFLGLVLLAVGWTLVFIPPPQEAVVEESDRPEQDDPEERTRRLRPVIEGLQEDLAAQEARRRFESP